MEKSHDKRLMWVKVRMAIVMAVVLAMFAAVVGRVYYLQTVELEHLTEKAHDQLNRSITLKAKRGSIVDRRGVELAVSVEAPSIAIRPRVVKDHDATATALAQILGLDYEEVREKFNKKARFVWVTRQTNPSHGEQIAALDIKGVEVHTESKRFYPLKETAGQLLGFTNIDGVGLEGLERAFESEIAGGEYRIDGVRDARGRTLLTDDTPDFRRFEGDTVVLTIDERIQRVAEQALARQVAEFEAKAGYVVAMDPKTGEVLALANTPSFDPNHFKAATPDDWRLRVVTDTFEPGSVFKPFVLAGALQEGTTTVDTMYDCENGGIQIGKYRIRDSHPMGMSSAATIIKESSNVGAYKIAQTMGRERLYQYLRAFGFGRPTGIGLRGEQPGVVWPPDRWAEVSFANIAFGQGVTSTPVQLVAAMAVIANGGMLLKPYTVKQIINRDGEVVRENTPTLVRRVLSEDAAEQTAWAMSLVTRKGGTGTKAAMEHYTVAGKTGTAQKVNPETRRYDNLWVGSFIGFVPAEDPEIVIAVMIDEPKGRGFGGVVAAPAFHEIAAEALKVRGVVPLPEEERFQFPESEESVFKKKPKPDAPIELELAETRVGPERIVVPGGVPDFRGLTLRQAIGEARKHGVLPRVEGWGRVVSQSPPPGEPILGGEELALVLSPSSWHSLMAEEPSLGPTE